MRQLIVLILLTLPISAFATTREEAKALFDRYNKLSDAFDPAVVQLYADDATISTYRRYPMRLERDMKLSGAQWKKLVAHFMPLAKAKDDRSEFKDVKFAAVDGAIRISAQRYSTMKCYWDPNYYMVVRKQSDGSVKIIEEYMETQPESDCRVP